MRLKFMRISLMIACLSIIMLFFGNCAAFDHGMVFMSDPQFGWQNGDTENTVSDKFTQHAKSVLAMAKTPGCRGIVIVGDITNAGHEWQLNSYKKLYESSTSRIFPALGNHDYCWYVNDTWENRAATNSVEYLISSVGKLAIQDVLALIMGSTANPAPKLGISFDMNRETGYKFPEIFETITGSLDYSWNIDNIHYVHLNYHPDYQNSWSNFRSDKAERVTVNIRPSWAWLEKDLATARKQGKVIILMVHDVAIPEKEERFKDILDEYSVSAVFCGHTHGANSGTIKTKNGSVPTYYCGSADLSKYLYASFGPETMNVKIIDSSRGTCEVVGTLPSAPLKHPVTNFVVRSPGRICIKNSGGYVAKYRLSYSLGGNVNDLNSGDVWAGNNICWDVPADATNLHLRMWSAVWIDTWNEFMSQDIERPDSRTDYYRSKGAVWSEGWDRNQ